MIVGVREVTIAHESELRCEREVVRVPCACAWRCCSRSRTLARESSRPSLTSDAVASDAAAIDTKYEPLKHERTRQCLNTTGTDR